MKHPYEVKLKLSGYDNKGYAIAYDDDAHEYHILNGLDGEEINAMIYKHKSKIRFGRAIEILKENKYRQLAQDDSFTETSPWQIMSFNYENEVKLQFLNNLLNKINFTGDIKIIHGDDEYGYRNKMEFGFFFKNDDSVTLAFHQRDTKRGKISVHGSALLDKQIRPVLDSFIIELNKSKPLPHNLKALLVRYSYYENKIILGLYVKDKLSDFNWISDWANTQKLIKGFLVIYSNPKSPALIETEVLNSIGDTILNEKVNKLIFTYPYNSFFQVNPSVFEKTIIDLRKELENIPNINKFNIGEYYAGVGAIGISIADLVNTVTAIEISTDSKIYSSINAKKNNINNFNLIEAKSENTLDILNKFDLIIVDPPRVGLHSSFIKAINDVKPKYIIYLGCNPLNQIGDIQKIIANYNVVFYRGYNFYPKTPHVEGLAILKRRVNIV